MAISTPTRPRGLRNGRPATQEQARPERGRLRSTATAWLAHPLASRYLVAVPAALLLLLGTVMVWSASSVYAYTQFGDSYTFIRRQLIFLAIGLVAVLIMQRIPLDTLRRLGWIMFGLSGILMCVPFFAGKRIKGNLNWIDFGGSGMIRLQPSEIAKIVIILWGACVFANKRKYLQEPRHLLVPFLPGALILIGLTVLQHDLGTSVIMGLIVVAMLWNVGASLRILGTMAAGVGAVVLGLVAITPYRMQRILGFLDPTTDPNGINYQPNQAQYGLATGGWWGVGLGASRQKWGSLSEAHTDYVLAVIGEELGVVVTLAVVVLFLILGYAGFRIALRSGTFHARLVASGITCWIMIQAVVNMFMVLRLLPVLGVPLPLVSYGGSSLVMNMAALGILLRCAREEPDAQDFLARQKRARQPRGRLSAVLGVRRRRQDGDAT